MLMPFELCEPASVGEASALLARHGDAARVYAGGTELLLAMKEGLAHYDYLVNVKTIPGLSGVRLGTGGALHVGAVMPHRVLERDPVARERFPALARMEGDVANVRVREVGTLGGNLCFAEPHSDPGTLLQVYDATVRLERAGGARTVPVERLFVGPFETCLEATPSSSRWSTMGQLLTPSLIDYRVPVMADVPAEYESILVENGDGPGPYGAKGIGESGLLPTAPAIANAIARATGVRLTDLPLTPERVWRAIVAAKGDAE